MKYILSILSMFCICSCHNHSAQWERICDVGNYIEERPDSALAILGAIDTDNLRSGEERAKYALHLSMALDKNYIDCTDFEILQPAIDYYDKHGTPTDKLRTSYYQGRIYQNKGDNENALNCFIVSMDVGKNSDDLLTKARSLYAQGYIYGALFDWNRLIRVSKEAGAIYLELNRKDQYLKCLVRIANAYTLKMDFDLARDYLQQAGNLIPDVGMSAKSNYYSTYLSYAALCPGTSAQEVEQIVEKYLDAVDEVYVDWLSVADIYAQTENFDAAFSCIQRYQLNDSREDQAKYYALLSDIYDNKSMPKQSLEAYKQYVSVSDSLDLVVYEQDTKFVEERHQLEMATLAEKERKQRLAALFAVMLSLLAGLALWISGRLRLSKIEKVLAEKELDRYRLLYTQMEEERDNLNALLSQRGGLDPEARCSVDRRLALLNKFFTAYITDNTETDKKAYKEMEELLEDRQRFMDSTRLAFTGSNPSFIMYLEDKGLTQWEINYCCLYALGLNGKEVGAYIKMRSHYNNSSAIREKLGIDEHDTNLGIYIRKLARSFIAN